MRKQSDIEKAEIEQIEELKRKYIKDAELLQREGDELRLMNGETRQVEKEIAKRFLQTLA